MNTKIENLEFLNERFATSSPEEILSFLKDEYHCNLAFSTSLGAEDQVMTHLIASGNQCIRIFTLDTGRLFYETYDLIERTAIKYGINIEIIFPDYPQVENMLKEKGVNLFYNSIENRKLCCSIRKTIPLKRALKGHNVWITGIRREQSVTRENMKLFEWEPELDILKVNPLINWTEEQIWQFIRKHKIPYNILHDKGYLSIGCAPCTRAVEKGEPSRNGRWWWENPETKECGLHLKVKTS